MATMILPGQFSDRAEFYHQTASLLEAGFGLHEIFRKYSDRAPVRSMQRPMHVIWNALEEGCTFSEAIHRTQRWIPEFDAALLESGERSGRMVETLKVLSEYYRNMGSMLRQVYSDMAYPLMMVMAAILILPVVSHAPELVKGDFAPYLRTVFMAVLPLVLLVAGGLAILKSRRFRWVRGVLERLLNWIPVVGTARRQLSLARLSIALEALLSAGVGILEGWPLAARAGGSILIEEEVARWRPALEQGQTPAERVNASRLFPEYFAGMYATGEASGKLDEHLSRIAGHYQETSTHLFRQVAQWMPRLIYFGVVFFIAWQIIKFWAGYFGQVNELLQ